MTQTHNFQIWNRLSNKDDLGIANFIELLLKVDDGENGNTQKVTVHQENGHKYIGRLKNGKKHDQNGVLYYEDYVYTGPF